MSERRRVLVVWLLGWLGTNSVIFLIALDVIDFGLWWVDSFVCGFLALAFTIWINNSGRALRAQYADARPHVGYIVHANGSQTAVRFIATSDPGEFLAVTLDGERVTMHEGDELKIDRVKPGQVIRFNLKN